MIVSKDCHNGREYFIGGNLKMRGTRNIVEEIITKAEGVNFNTTQVVLCPPAPLLQHAKKLTENSKIEIGAQNMFNEASGPYTGEIGYEQLSDLNVEWAIIGHSDRRHTFSEPPELIIKKAKFASEKNMNIILCIGEKKEERDEHKTNTVCEDQLKPLLEMKDVDWSKIVIAYEPVWAIGTTQSASVSQVEEVHKFIRQLLQNHIGAQAEKVCILYGGGTTTESAKELSSLPDVDGFLIHGAMFKPGFESILNLRST